MINPFFENKGPIKIEKLLAEIKVNDNYDYSEVLISDVKNLVDATNKDITFFHSKKYESAASQTNAYCCITTKQLSNFLSDLRSSGDSSPWLDRMASLEETNNALGLNEINDAANRIRG